MDLLLVTFPKHLSFRFWIQKFFSRLLIKWVVGHRLIPTNYISIWFSTHFVSCVQSIYTFHISPVCLKKFVHISSSDMSVTCLRNPNANEVPDSLSPKRIPQSKVRTPDFQRPPSAWTSTTALTGIGIGSLDIIWIGLVWFGNVWYRGPNGMEKEQWRCSFPVAHTMMIHKWVCKHSRRSHCHPRYNAGPSAIRAIGRFKGGQLLYWKRNLAYHMNHEMFLTMGCWQWVICLPHSFICWIMLDGLLSAMSRPLWPDETLVGTGVSWTPVIRIPLLGNARGKG